MPNAPAVRRSIAGHSAAHTRAPSKKKLLSLFGTNNFHKQITWSEKPSAELSKLVINLEKPKPGQMGGQTINARFVKGHPDQVIFERQVHGCFMVPPRYSQVFDIDAPLPRGI